MTHPHIRAMLTAPLPAVVGDDGMGASLRLAFEVPPPCPILGALLLCVGGGR